ncbi:MAG: 1-deoxy-D-xylulose-5-phosphate reductoisomerase [Planctomycetota bacterium]|nr:1-deoxy-D-xylulose-5-phosphate reductoisomerase [Planctomycetota bacterium]MDI6788157.1 1-deoxy-D-xylulose-5-phosphate reductoisomerase [Planctomycetota bacterium]
MTKSNRFAGFIPRCNIGGLTARQGESASGMTRKNIVILGASGSVGQNTLSVINNLNSNGHHFHIKAIVNNSNWQITLNQIRRFSPEIAIINDYSAFSTLKNILFQEERRRGKYCRTKLLLGDEAIRETVSAHDVDIVVSAISGAKGLYPTLWAIKHNKTVLLANKESLVIAGELLRTLNGFKKIIPVDSEHSGLFQIITPHINGRTAGFCPTGINKPFMCGVKRVIITASGGPFYNLSKQELKRVTPSMALRHPTYKMGNKISIDSATLMNKALEIIEAHYLFNIPAEKIEVLIHPQSVVHAMVEFADGSIIAQMNQPDMRLPIQYALTHPRRFNSQIKPVFQIPNPKFQFTFLKPDTKKFPALLLGYEVIRRGGTSGAVLNAANEEAVNLFLKKRIRFTDITESVSRVLLKHKPLKLTLENIAKADAWARARVGGF